MKEKDTKNYNIRAFEGFSLIELSIVILIIGLIIAGVIAGKKLIAVSNLSKARSLTSSSPVSGIEDLGLWLETTSKDSFGGVTPSDSSQVSIWYDINPQKNVKNNTTQSTSANQPTYITSSINGLPGVRFNGSNNYLSFTSNINNFYDQTWFIVAQPNSALSGSFTNIVGNGGAGLGVGIGIYKSGGILKTGFTIYGRADYYSPSSWTVGKAQIVDIIFNVTAGTLTFYKNGAADSTISGTAAISTNSLIPVLGAAGPLSQFLNADLGEVIYFNRVLSDFERQEIEKYLSKKWGIKLS